MIPALVQAQDAVLNQLYGRGVHSYFSGDYVSAQRDLTAVIRQGSRDPRSYYYRGLTFLSLGQDADARRDFAKGAALEATAQDEFYDVSKALERVQGRARLELERYRAAARMANLERAEKIRKARYEEFCAEQRRVLLQPAEEIPLPPGAARVRRGDKFTADAPFMSGPIDDRTALEAAVDAPPVAVPNAPLVVQPAARSSGASRAGVAPAAKKSEEVGRPASTTNKAAGGSGKWGPTGGDQELPDAKPAEAVDNPFLDEPAPAEGPAAKKASSTKRAATKRAESDNPFGE